MYGSMEQSTTAAAPALGPEEVKFVRKLMATNGDDAQSRDSCLQDGIVDDNCCAPCGHGSCASGYTYAGQFFIDEEMRSSTYPDFGSMCGDLFCGHTCCVPSDEWEGTYDKMKKWANESRIPQWVLDKAAAAAGD